MVNKQLQYAYWPISSDKNHAENVVRRLVSDLFLFFKKALYEIEIRGLQLSFQYFLFFKKALYEIKVRDLQLNSDIFR